MAANSRLGLPSGMTGVLCLCGVLLLLAAIATAIAGWRGRIVDTTLCCGSCGYLLNGVQRTPATRCAECGGRVWTGSVLRPVRQPKTRLLRMAMLCMSCSGLTMGATTIARFDVVHLQQFSSTESLMEQISATTSAHPQSGAWAELLRRKDTGVIDADVRGDIMAIALDRHLAMMRTASQTTDNGLWPIPPRVGSAHKQWLQAAIGGGHSEDIIEAYHTELDRLAGKLRTAQASARQPTLH